MFIIALEDNHRSTFTSSTSVAAGCSMGKFHNSLHLRHVESKTCLSHPGDTINDGVESRPASKVITGVHKGSVHGVRFLMLGSSVEG